MNPSDETSARRGMGKAQAVTIPQALDIALQHHQAGRLAEAEGIYRQILAAQPNHADALHRLGVVAIQIGRHEIAVDLICQAIAVNPAAAHYHLDLGNALSAQGHPEKAIAAYHSAIGRNPNFAMAHNNLGAALKAKGQLDEAVISYRKALAITPGSADFHSNLRLALQEKGQFDEAGVACRSALQIKPDHAPACYNLGNALQSQGRLDEAAETFRRSLRIRPNHANTLNNLGAVLRDSGHLDEALTAFHQAIRVEPNLPETYNNLGIALKDLGQFDGAAAACRQALQLRPGYPEAYLNLGVALAASGGFDESIAAYRRALELRPDWPEAHNNLGTALKDLTRFDEAVAAFRQALQINPGYAPAHSNLVYTLHFCPDAGNRMISDEHNRWNSRFGEPMRHLIQPHTNDCDPDRKLRIGYVSSDFRNHAAGHNMLPLLRRHDRDRFDLLCYSGVARPDWMTERFRALPGEWRITVGVPDAELAEMVRKDRVDILVDLALHTSGNRLSMFARQPAPVQASFGGYPGHTGLESIRYRISDPRLEADLLAASGACEEARLIDSFWCYDPCEAGIEVNSLPANQLGTVTFGCLNNFCKVNEKTLVLWARVLRRVNNSSLILMSSEGSHRQRALEVLTREGVAERRVEFVQHRPLREYLEQYHRLDIILDTFPYNGHTTSLDALWMGVPVVSLFGEPPVSRAGLSQLSNLGLPELAVSSEEDFVKVAVALAGDLPRLTELRSTLRHRMETSVLMDAPRFARQVERAYREMWRAWCLRVPSVHGTP